MKAIRVHQFGPPDVLRIEEVPEPTPAKGQVVVAMRAAGVNPVETYIRSGTYAQSPSLPYTPGWDGAGVVESVGEGVTNLEPGARVWLAGTLSGTYAEKALCEAEHLFALPESLSFAQGAALYTPYATAWRALFQRAQARPGETVLVHGASGGVGMAAVQLARAAGMTVLATAGSEQGRRHALADGAAHALDHTEADHLERVLALTGGRGVDVVLEMLANVNLGKDLAALAPGARLVVVGNRGTVEINPRELMNREASVLGMRLPNASAAERASFLAAVEAAAVHQIARPRIGAELPLAQAPQAHRQVMEQRAAGKIVLVP